MYVLQLVFFYYLLSTKKNPQNPPTKKKKGHKNPQITKKLKTPINLFIKSLPFYFIP